MLGSGRLNLLGSAASAWASELFLVQLDKDYRAASLWKIQICSLRETPEVTTGQAPEVQPTCGSRTKMEAESLSELVQRHS